MADSVGDNHPHLTFTMARPILVVGKLADCVGDKRPHLTFTIARPNLVVGKLAGSVGGNRTSLIPTTRRPTNYNTRRQIVGKSSFQPDTEKSYLADIFHFQQPFTLSLARHVIRDGRNTLEKIVLNAFSLKATGGQCICIRVAVICSHCKRPSYRGRNFIVRNGRITNYLSLHTHAWCSLHRTNQHDNSAYIVQRRRSKNGTSRHHRFGQLNGQRHIDPTSAPVVDA